LKRFLAIVFVLVIVAGFGCRDDEIVPPPFEEPGRRDYTWTVDTLRANPGDMFHMSSLWGSALNDVWAVGGADAANIAKWHYDGLKWTADSTRISSSLLSVYGFSSNDIWTGDAPGGNLWHYNGSGWISAGNFTPQGFSSLSINNIWGDSPSNIFAVGAADSINGSSYLGKILHYDGRSWNFVKIPPIRITFGWMRRDFTQPNLYYLMGTRFESTGDSVKIYKYNGKTLKQIYANSDGSMSLNEIGGRVFFTDTKRILVYSDSVFRTFLDFTSTGVRLGTPCGRNYKDIFAGGVLGGKNGLLHYNGTDLTMIYEIPTFVWYILLLPSDIFILTHDGTYPIVIHGVLK